MKMNKFLLALLLLGLLFASVSHAEDIDDDDDAPAGGDSDEAPGHAAPEEDEDEPKAQGSDAPGVSVRAFFPKNRDLKFPAGDYVETLVAVENSADNQNFRVEYILAYLRGSDDATYYIQNFTGSQYNRTVVSGGITSIKYRFKPDSAIDPRPYGLVVQAFYQNDDNETFLSTAFNGTVTIAEPSSYFDASSILGYATLIGGGLVAAYFAKGKFFPATKEYRKRRPAAEQGTDISNVDLDFVPKEHLNYLTKSGTSPKTTSPKLKK